MGRPAVLANSKQLETKFPADPHETLHISGEAEPSFHHWKYRYSKECIMPLLDEVLGAEPPTYQTILRLDASLRRFPIPPSMQLSSLDEGVAKSNVGGSNVTLEMQKYFMVWLKESSKFTHHVLWRRTDHR